MTPLPREHGAWAMLALSLLTGWALRGRPDAQGLLLTGGWVLLFLGQEGLARHGLAPTVLLVCGTGAAALGTGALLEGPATLAALGAASALGLVSLALRRNAGSAGRVPLFAWGPHLMAALTMAAPVALLGSRLDPTRAAFVATGTALGFGAGVLAVRARRTSRGGALALALWSLVAIPVWILAAPSPLAWAAWFALPLRLVQLRLQPRLGWKAVGWSETALGLWTALWLCL